MPHYREEYTGTVEIRNGRVYVTRMVADLDPEKQFTKWDFLSDWEREKLQTQTFGKPCGKCDTMLNTEADFAKHFIVTNPRYFNLGECPSDVGAVRARFKE